MLYQYFHPHFNPRLRLVPVRMQEIGELEQATKELKRAVERAQTRSELAGVENITAESFAPIVDALTIALHGLGELMETHPGDDEQTLRQLVEERSNTPGWEGWVQLVSQRMMFS